MSAKAINTHHPPAEAGSRFSPDQSAINTNADHEPSPAPAKLAGEKYPWRCQPKIIVPIHGPAGRGRFLAFDSQPPPKQGKREKNAEERGGAGTDLAQPDQDRGESNSGRPGQQGGEGETG